MLSTEPLPCTFSMFASAMLSDLRLASSTTDALSLSLALRAFSFTSSLILLIVYGVIAPIFGGHAPWY